MFFGSNSWLRYSSNDYSADSRDSAATPSSPTYKRQDVAPLGGGEGNTSDGAFTAPSASSVGPLDQPRVETVRLSDGSIEALDADLVIGRNPGRESLGAHQRAVMHGVGDRTISRRHLELRMKGSELMALCLGKKMRLERDGASQELPSGAEERLVPGDTLYYGISSWLRYEDVQRYPLSDPSVTGDASDER